MLSGLHGTGDSMFPHMTAGVDRAPSPEEMEKAMQAVQFNKVVKLKNLEVRTYNLWDDKQAAKYKKDRMHVMNGMQRNELTLLCADRKFVEAIPGYIAHMEWIEYELKVDPVKPSAAAAQGDTDG